MVYSGGFVICVLVNGKVQEERVDGIVIVPEGTKYSIRLRNKNSRRAVGQIFIDGENVSDGGYVVNAHSHIEIHRFADKDEAFVAVGLNSPEAVDAGKNGPNDGTKGVIEVRFRLERAYQTPMYPLQAIPAIKKGGPWRSPESQPWISYDAGHSHLSRKLEKEILTSASNSMQDAVTVGGARTGQDFSYTNVNLEHEEVILKIVLKVGEPQSNSHTKGYCPSCGAKMSKTDRFCSHCGKKRIIYRS